MPILPRKRCVQLPVYRASKTERTEEEPDEPNRANLTARKLCAARLLAFSWAMDLHVSTRQQRELLSRELLVDSCTNNIAVLFHPVVIESSALSITQETRKPMAKPTKRQTCVSWYSYLRSKPVTDAVPCTEATESDCCHPASGDKLQWFDDLEQDKNDAQGLPASCMSWKAPAIQLNGTKVVDNMKRHQLRMQKARSQREMKAKQVEMAWFSPKKLELNPPRKRRSFFRLNITERKAIIAKWMTGLDAKLFSVNECGLMVL